MTNGDTGHFAIGGGVLAQRRYKETQASAKIADLEYIVLDIHSGEMEATIENRKLVVRMMREMDADLVFCHRANDYHPDHRAVGTLVQDASYIVTVPNMAALTPHLKHAPVIAYFYDTCKVPNPFVPTIAIDIDDVVERKVAMLHCHASQLYEWLPYNDNTLKLVPKTDKARKAWLTNQMQKKFGKEADDCRETLKTIYGGKHGAAVKAAEGIMISEYGRSLPEKEFRTLFPFLPKS